jgi:uncharacterized protein (TIGR00299 family) protein
MKIAYLDCFSGVSGDMFVGALIDAGLPIEELEKTIAGLSFSDCKVSIKKEERNNIFGTRFLVSASRKNQKTRSFKDIKEVLRASNLPPTVPGKCIAIFEKLAVAEGAIHHISPEKVHFHELGAVDSIIDIVSTVVGVHILGIEKLFASRIPVGTGMTTGAHGKIPVPAPATLALLKGIPIYDSGQDVEMVTPTGAALIASLCSSFGPLPPLTIDKIGYGVGTRVLTDRPNILRILIGNDIDQQQSETVVVLESNLDDMNPELLGYLMDRLFDAGARDASFLPIHMKKNRPGIQLQVIGRPEDKDKLIAIIFRESTTLGVRISYNLRAVLQRTEVTVDSPWGKVKVKEVANQDGTTTFLPEYEECRRVAKNNNLALRDIYAWAASTSFPKRS